MDLTSFNMNTNLISKFLQWCAGADKQLLVHATVTDHIKMTCIGGLIMLAGGLAFGGMLYFFATSMTESELWSVNWSFHWVVTILLSLCWFLIVFNLCRMIVIIMGYGDGTSKVTFSEFKSSLASFLVTIVFSICSGVPLAVGLLSTHVSGFSSVQMELFNSANDRVDQQYGVQLMEAYTNLAKAKQQVLSASPVVTKSVNLKIENDAIIGYQDKLDLIRNTISLLKQKNFDSASQVSGFFSDADKVWASYPGFATAIVLVCWLIFISPPLLKIMWVKGPYENLVIYHDKMVLNDHGISVDGEFERFLQAEKILKYHVERHTRERKAIDEKIARHRVDYCKLSGV